MPENVSAVVRDTKDNNHVSFSQIKLCGMTAPYWSVV